MIRAAIVTLFAAALCGQEPAPVIRARGPQIKARRIAAAVTPADGKRWRFAHPSATVLGGLNLRKFREPAPALLQQWTGAAGFPGTALVQSLLADIDSVSISLDGARKDGQPLILLAGRFQNPELRKVLQIPESMAGAPAILLGDPLSVTAAKRRLRTTGANLPIVDQAIRLAEANDFWVAGDAKALSTLPAGAHATASDFLDGVQAFALGLNMGNRIVVNLDVSTASPAHTGKILALYETAREKARETIEGRETWDEIARNLQVSKSESGLNFHLDLDPATIPADAARRLGANIPASAAPARSARRTVVIHGMEEGTREIPLSQPR